MEVKISYHPQFDKNEMENVSDDYIRYLLNNIDIDA